MDLVNEIVEKVAPKKKEEEHEVEGIALSERELEAAEEVLDVLDPYGCCPEPEPRENETELQKKQRELDRKVSEERRRLKAEVLGKTLKAFFLLCDAEPHSDGEHEEADEGGDEE